jgi:hypothetical protein
MPRWFVCVNTRQKRITFHPEGSGRCGHICKHIKVGGAYSGSFRIARSKQYKTIKIKVTGNEYWLIVWAKNIQKARKHPSIKKAYRDEKVVKAMGDCKSCR